jgi:pimeloyl-ACP methyl ester carboxylesterase
MTRKKKLKKIGWGLLITFILLNIVAYFHAYQFTHFGDNSLVRTKDPKELTLIRRIKSLTFGINNPRPTNGQLPDEPYETIHLKSNKMIECWLIKAHNAKGTVVLFHGFAGEKSSLLDKSLIFEQMGYNTMLVDFMGSGGSEGNQTTIGFFEAEEVKTCFDYLQAHGEKKIYLWGTSMGAVAIMKAISDYGIQPTGIMIECPFGSMYETVCARFRLMHAPTFPMAGLLVFWGGLQNNFWAFGHNPVYYAKKISCPTLLMYGELDDKVSSTETDQIYANLQGKKELKVYPLAGHENYLNKYEHAWKRDVADFLARF